MNAYAVMGTIWAVITAVFFALVVCRSRLTKQESDWIPLTDDAKEDKAIQAQTIIDMKARKFTWPIRLLGAASIGMLLVMLGYWLYTGIMTPPPPPQ
jgi:hypothetical protein